MALTLPLKPFSRPTSDVHLERAPVVRVLAQLRYPASTGLVADSSAMTRIAAALAVEYPSYQEGVEASFQFAGVGQAPATSTHRTFIVRSASAKTAVTVSPTSLTYETSEYDSRETLLRELEAVLLVALPIIRPSSFDRIGVRYSNLFDRDDQLARNVRSAIFAAEEVASDGVELHRAINEAVYQVDATSALLVRSALLPTGITIDPGITVPTEGGGTFLLDLDSFTPGSTNVTEVNAVVAKIKDLAELASRYFFSSLTEEGANNFGAKNR